ncbi:MAG: InlB B-repeat-containing protein [Treponema sp.]|nr:InlB B-repeat-containing protein [Treponema sp.]
MKELKNTNTAKRIFGLLHLPAILALLLASCSNGINGTDASRDSADGKTYISINAKTVQARSIAPNADDYSTEKLTDLVLSGKTIGEGTDSDTATDTEAVTLAQAESLAELSGKSIPIEAGNWLLTLSATLNGVTFYGETRAEIEKGKINPISFTLTPATSYGGMSITVEFTGEADKVSVSLKKAGNEELLAGSELTPVQGSDGKKSVTFSRSASAEAERLESGSYYLLFEFFGVDEVGRLNTVENIVRVKEGITTTAKLTLDLNEIYTITYETNGGVPASTNTVLTDKYSRKSEALTLPKMKKEGYAFAGWYESADFTGSPVTEIAKGSAGNKTLYAAYANSVTVSPSGNNLTCNGLSEDALSIDYAVSLINGWNDPTIDYTIYIDGELTYVQTIADSVEGGTLTKIKAASITLEGKSGSSTDKINAGWDGDTDNLPDSENNIGTALVIETSVPVTIKNLTVTGGCAVLSNESDNLGGGIQVGGVYSDGDTEKPFEASITLSSGAVVTKNYANGYGGGVYVSFGSNLTIEEGAEISGNTGYGGGVCIYPCGTDSIEGTFETTVTMNGGSISGNTGFANTDGSFGGGGVLVYDYSGSASFVMNGGSISENTCKGYGGGVCIYGENVKFTMNGGTIGGSTSDNGNSSTTYNGYGGGVYINGGSTFEMIDGAISCNKSEATSYGGGGAVFISSGTFDMKGGSLTDNTTTYQGGGVYIASAGIFNMTGGSISGNTATNDGNGVYQYNYNGSTGTFSMGGSAVVAEDNDVFVSGTITIAGSLTGEPPVATITPEEYTAGTELLEVAADSDTTLAAEYEKFAVSDSDFWNITTEGKLKKIFFGTKKPTEEKAVYDIVFSDGSATPYTDGLTLSDEEKAAAIAVIFYKGKGLNSPDSNGNADTTTERTLGVGLVQTKDLWCGDPNGSNPGNAWNVLVEPIECAPNEGIFNYETTAGNYTFPDTADKNGSDNLSQIAAYLPTQTDSSNNYYTNDTGTAARYPAFYFGINYKNQTESHVSGTNYEDNWYLPSIAELLQLGKVVTDVNSAISLCGGTLVKTSSGDNYYDYFSSSQYENYSYCTEAYTMRFDSPLYIGTDEKTSDSIYVLAIREF